MGRSALGKGFPVNVAKKLVTMTKATRVISGRNSIQSVVKDLSQSVTSEDGTPPFKDSRGFFVSSEFATSIIKDEAALTILTDLYDCHWNEEWANKIISRGIDKVVKPNLTLLSGSSPSHFFDSIPQTNITGGFVGRMLIISEEKRSKINDLMSDVEGETIIDITFPYDKLALHLRGIHEAVKDQDRKFIWTREAANVWKAWYTPARQREETEQDDKTGFKGRLPDHVLKVAMCLSLSEGTSLKINEANIEEAIDKVSGLVYTSKKVASGSGKDPLAPQAKIILDYMLSAPNHSLRRQILLRKGYGDFDSAALDRIVDGMFIETNWITKEKEQFRKKNGEIEWDIVYTLTPEAVAQYEQFKGEKK